MRAISQPRAQRGVSLVELMIAVVLGLLLLAGVAELFVSSKQGYRIQDSSSRMQENMRFALEALTRHVRQADFWGGLEAAAITSLTTTTPDSSATPCSEAWALVLDEPIRGYEGAKASPLGDCTVTDYVPFSDVLVLRFADPGSFTLWSELDSLSETDFKSDGAYWLRVQVGRNGRLFDFSNKANAATAIPATDPANPEIDGISHYKYQIAVLFIRTDTVNGRTVPTLWRRDLSSAGVGNSEQLVEGIEQMQLAYGLDADNDEIVERYLPASSLGAGDWQNVVAVRVSLIVRGDTLDEFVDTNTYEMAGGYSYTPAQDVQRYQRRLVTRDIQIRNRSR